MYKTINDYFYLTYKQHNDSYENISRFDRQPFVDCCMKTLGLEEKDAKKIADENFYYTLKDGCFVPSDNLKKFIECAENFYVDENISYKKSTTDIEGNVLYKWDYFPEETIYSDFKNMMRFLFLTRNNKKREHAFIRVIGQIGDEYNYFDLLETTKPGSAFKYRGKTYTFPLDYRIYDQEESCSVIRTDIDQECEELYKLISSSSSAINVAVEIKKLKNSNKTFSNYIDYIKNSSPLILISLYLNASNIQKKLYDKLLRLEGTSMEKLAEIVSMGGENKMNYMYWKNADKFFNGEIINVR